jgi:hypothetical protein
MTAARPRRHVLRSLLVVLPSLIAVPLGPATTAHADGPPVTSLDAGPEGVVEHTGGDRYTAHPLATKTVLTRSQTKGGRVLRASIVDGRWGVPLVAHDGTSGGLSADGSTLVLTRIAKAYPRRHTGFAVVDTGPLAFRDSVELEGEWSFDALSPDGRWLYLIEQLSPRDPTRYAVRVYDLENDRLLEKPVVDPREPDEPMNGLPITRATGPEGRWEYTLYAGGEYPFIHALDTVRRTSLCLDLPQRVAKHRRIWAMRLAVEKGRVAVVHGDKVVASAARRPRHASVGGGPPWLAAAIAAAGLLLAAGGARRTQAASRRRRELR